MVENDKEYIVTIENDSNLYIKGNCHTNLYLIVTSKVENEETNATFGIKVDGTNNPTITLKQDVANMNIKGNGTLHISAIDIKMLILGEVLISHEGNIF